MSTSPWWFEPSDYATVTDEIETFGGATTLTLRRRLAAKAFARTAAYDAAIARRLAAETEDELLPARFVLRAASAAGCCATVRTPIRVASLYVDPTAPPGVAQADLIQGKEPSYNNLADADAAYGLVREFGSPAIAIIKHGNPCGVGLGGTLAAAYDKARVCDPVSAFGGVVASNRPLDGATTRAIAGLFTEVVIAPEADAEARAVLAAKADLRLLLTGVTGDDGDERLMVRTLDDGFLVQTQDTARVTAEALKTVTKRAPTKQERADLLFAFTVAKHVKSNAHCLRQGRRHGRHRRRPDEPRRLLSDRGAEGRRRLRCRRRGPVACGRLCGRLRRVLSLCGRALGCCRGRRHRRDSAGRLETGRTR